MPPMALRAFWEPYRFSEGAAPERNQTVFELSPQTIPNLLDSKEGPPQKERKAAGPGCEGKHSHETLGDSGEVNYAFSPSLSLLVCKIQGISGAPSISNGRALCDPQSETPSGLHPSQQSHECPPDQLLPEDHLLREASCDPWGRGGRALHLPTPSPP